MVGHGIGHAPFRGFLQRDPLQEIREIQDPAKLCFECRTIQQDLICEDDRIANENNGVTDLHDSILYQESCLNVIYADL